MLVLRQRTLLILVSAYLLLISFNALADDRKDRLVGLINEELKEVVRLSKQINHRDPNVLLRIAELQLEKARLIRDDENNKFLSLPPQNRTKKARRAIFNDSQNLFKTAQKTAKIIIKNFRKYKNIGEVYYILAFNAKEFNDERSARKYFKSAIKYSKTKSKTELKSKVALAEIYFNEGHHKKAIPLYEAGLEKKINKWWTKDSYNLAWCYYKVKKYGLAISKLKEVIQLSSNSNYINMKSYGENDLGLFYASMGDGEKAVAYYKNSSKNPIEQLIRLAKNLIDQEKISIALNVLNQSLQIAKSRSDIIEIHTLKLAPLEKYGKYSDHLETCRKLIEIHRQVPLPDRERDLLLYHVKKAGAILQKQVIADTYNNVKSVKARKGKQSSAYFAMAAELEPNKSYKALLHAAETSYAVGNFDEAVVQYDMAYNASKNAGKAARKYKLAALEGQLDALGKKVSKSTSDKYLLKTYTNYLGLDSKSKRAEKIYQKVFNIHMENKDLVNAEDTLKKYQRSFPRNRPKQEAMLAKIMDHFKDSKNIDEFRNYVSRIEKGEFYASGRYRKAVKSYLLTVQFEDVEKANTKGNKVRALKGYIGIFNDIKSSKSAKKNAAYNIMILYHELKDINSVMKWYARAFELMNEKDIVQFAPSFFTVTTEIFNRGLVDDSTKNLKDCIIKFVIIILIKKMLFFKMQ